MKAMLMFLLLCGACAISSPGVQHRAAIGDSCDPNALILPCGPGLTCSADCGVGLTCDSTGVCGVPCGGGNTVCDSTTLCTQSADCIPPCRDTAGAPIYRVPKRGSCEGSGLITMADGRCLVPCWYVLCDVLGGVSC